MGADIHATIEVRPYAREWRPFAVDVSIDRDYELFGMLAHVRRDDMPMIGHPGLPINPTPEWLAMLADGQPDWHSHGWVLFVELPTTLAGRLFYDVMDVVAARYGVDRVRLVYAFDN